MGFKQGFVCVTGYGPRLSNGLPITYRQFKTRLTKESRECFSCAQSSALVLRNPINTGPNVVFRFSRSALFQHARKTNGVDTLKDSFGTLRFKGKVTLCQIRAYISKYVVFHSTKLLYI